jgi:hypothetical protein
MTATFMPKPLFGDNGSGMHVHSSIWQGERPLFAGDGYAGSSELMRHYIGGLLKHAPALLAICAPTINSYRRLVPGFEAPVNLGYSQRNRQVVEVLVDRLARMEPVLHPVEPGHQHCRERPRSSPRCRRPRARSRNR